MKTISLLTLALIVTLMASTASASNGFGYLAADNDYWGTQAGEVNVSKDGSNLIITFSTYSGWSITETHLHVATDFNDIPQTKKGNPKIGQFDHRAEHVYPGVTTDPYAIPLPTVWPDPDNKVLYIAAHAVVWTSEDGEFREETAWGSCHNPRYGGNFPGKSWATYMIYYP